MNNKTEAQILADAYESVRNLSKAYLSQLAGLDVHKQYSINGVEVNTAYWIASHLVWTECFLILEGIGNRKSDIPWLEEYGFGTSPKDAKTKLPFNEVLDELEKVHKQAMMILNNLPDEELDKPNYIDATFGGKNNKRNVIKHAIRHEPMHIGQISWILKANGIKLT